MKIIDLLNKIANGEEVPKKIKYRDWLYEFEKDCNDYMCQYDSLLCRGNDDVRQFLNDTIEILEEEKKIPEKLKKYHFHNRQRQLANKINEIIDYLKSKGDE